MAQIEVVTLKPHSPDGVKRYKIGAKYHVSEAAARILVATKLVRIHTPEAPAETTEVETKRKYNRRDMRAED